MNSQYNQYDQEYDPLLPQGQNYQQGQRQNYQPQGQYQASGSRRGDMDELGNHHTGSRIHRRRKTKARKSRKSKAHKSRKSRKNKKSSRRR